jgi:hypothetical protein
MGVFIGGSAPAMAKEIAEGYILISPPSLRKFKMPELKSLEQELDKTARDLRSEIPAVDDTTAVQKRNRKLARVSQALLIIRNIVTASQRH